MARVRKAIFPVAGFGTRFLPATKAVPKELLPVVDRPLIQYAIDEALAAGIEQMIFVTGRGKHAIEDYFDSAFEIESDLLARLQGSMLFKTMRSRRPASRRARPRSCASRRWRASATRSGARDT